MGIGRVCAFARYSEVASMNSIYTNKILHTDDFSITVAFIGRHPMTDKVDGWSQNLRKLYDIGCGMFCIDCRYLRNH